MIEPFSANFMGPRAAMIALDIALKATVMIVLTFCGHCALGRRRALVRSALWNACLIGLLLIPAADMALPRLIITVGTERIIPREALPVRGFEGSHAPLTALNPSPIPLPEMPDATSLRTLQPSPKHTLMPSVRTRIVPGGIDIAFGVYLAGATLLAIRLGFACAGVARLKHASTSIDDPNWSESMERWRVELGIQRRVELLASDRLSVPVVVGSWRPAVIVPKRLAGSSIPGLIDAILLHELGHVRRGDFGWNLVRTLAHLVYWPHPLVWPIARTIENVREQACDDLCVHGLGGSAAYRATLLEVASGLIRRPRPSIGLAMAKDSNLGRRLAWIDRTRGTSRCLLRWPARLAMAVVVVTTGGVLGTLEPARATAKASESPQPPPEKAEAEAEVKPPVEDKAAEPAQAPKNAIEIIVRAKGTGQPIANASVRFGADSVRKLDAEGRIRLDFPNGKVPGAFAFFVWAEGYVQQLRTFSEKDTRHPRLPSQVIVELYPGEETLGGWVMNEQHLPVAGVKVEVWGDLGSKMQKEEMAYMVDTTTNEKGEWRCRCFREMTFANLYLSHPDYVLDDKSHPRAHGSPTRDSARQPGDDPLEPLRDFSDVQVLKRGVVVSGEVLDEHGKPVSSAEVRWIHEPAQETFRRDSPKTTTDERGRFGFSHVRRGRLALQVIAPGYATATLKFDSRPGSEPMTITLHPAKPPTGRVVDAQGEPDAAGRLRGDDTPHDPLSPGAVRSDVNAVSRKRIVPGNRGVSMTPKRLLSISGNITDSETKELVDGAKVEVGRVVGATGELIWIGRFSTSGTHGGLRVDLDADKAKVFRLRIKAKGYQPFESRAIRNDEGHVSLDVNLVKAAPRPGDLLSGVVLRPDGSPLEGAEVAITYPQAGRNRLPFVHIENGKLAPNQEITTGKTDRLGRFALSREPDPEGHYYALVVVHPDFYAEIPRPTFETNSTIKAGPWARIKGVIRVGTKVGAEAEVLTFADRLGNDDVPHVSDDNTTKADAQGRYNFERVVPGDVRIARGYGEGMNFKAWSNGVLVEARSGETATADIGGQGRTVVARIALPDGFDPKADYTIGSEFGIESDRPNIPYPRELWGNRDGSMVDWSKRWWASPEGHAYRRGRYVHIQAKLQPDGTLRVDDVPPGAYRLRLIYRAGEIRGAGAAGQVASVTKPIVIPDNGGSEPYDLGTLHPGPSQTLKVGEASP